MKQIYKQHSHFNEFAYKLGVLTYKNTQLTADIQRIMNPYIKMVFVK